jgi:tetratricopeptide (TPR) repeat protein
LVVDDPAASALLTRALALHPAEGPGRWSIQADLIEPLMNQLKLSEAAQLAEGIRAAADAAGDLQWVTRGRLEAARVRQLTAPEGATEILRWEAERAILVFGRLGDEVGLGFAHEALADVAGMSGDLAGWTREYQLAADHLTRAGRTQHAQLASVGALSAMIAGTHPASVALIEARRQVSTVDGRLLRMLTAARTCLLAELLGRTGEAHQAREHVETLGLEMPDATAGTAAWFLGRAALACGRAGEAAELLARACAVHESTGATGYLSTTAAYHAHALLLTGDQPAARRQVNRALETGSTDDVLTQGLAHSALAWAAAADGEDPTTVRQEMAAALAALEPTELILDRALVHAACAEAARLIGDRAAAAEHRRRAIDLYDAKENIVGAAVQRALLAAEVE